MLLVQPDSILFPSTAGASNESRIMRICERKQFPLGLVLFLVEKTPSHSASDQGQLLERCSRSSDATAHFFHYACAFNQIDHQSTPVPSQGKTPHARPRMNRQAIDRINAMPWLCTYDATTPTIMLRALAKHPKPVNRAGRASFQNASSALSTAI